MPHFTKPAEGSWTEHYPELGTEPVSYADSISPEFYELEREAIFGRTWLNVGRVEQLPKAGSYFTKELDAAGTSVVVVRGMDGEVRAFHNICRHRGNKLVWTRLPERGDERRVPPVHLQVPRLALLARGRAELRPAGAGVLRPRQGRLPARVGAVRRLGGVHLREPRRVEHHAAARVHGRARQGARGLPVPRADAGAQVPSGDRRQLEAVHRRLHRVLPRTGSAREAGGLQRIGEGPGTRLRGARVRHRRSARDGVVVGRHVAAQGPRAW